MLSFIYAYKIKHTPDNDDDDITNTLK